jgi:UDP-N-acetylmuramoyl-tripeptide--D-alanyl-D-alanine ligase
MSLPQVAAAMGVPVPSGPAPSGDVTVTSVEFDSRKVAPGALFVALTGETVDGHDFAVSAESAGAVAVLGSRPTAVAVPQLIVPGGNDGVLAALAALAAADARRLIDDGLTVVGVTGSVGKTSTKDLIAAVLRRAGSVVAPPESFNNEIGHPYTVLRADSSTRYLVLELSARGIGHIASLAAIAPPRIGVVLNVGSAHIGEFGSADAIAVAKGELVEALPTAAEGGIAILNADDPRVAAMASRTAARIVTTGVAGPADVRAVGVELDPSARPSFTLVTPEGSARVALRLIGEHQVANALAAAAVGRSVGVSPSVIAAALSEAEAASKWRMAVTELPGDVTVINDAYNSNPESVRAALSAIAARSNHGRTWAVLGPMAELGETAPAAHEAVGAMTADYGMDQVLVVGEAARLIESGARAAGARSVRFVPDAASALDLLVDEVAERDLVLIKASRSVNLQRLALALIDRLGAAGASGPSRSQAAL